MGVLSVFTWASRTRAVESAGAQAPSMQLTIARPERGPVASHFGDGPMRGMGKGIHREIDKDAY